MKIRLHDLLGLVSFSLCVFMATLWVRSLGATHLLLKSASPYLRIETWDGHLVITWWISEHPQGSWRPFWYYCGMLFLLGLLGFWPRIRASKIKAWCCVKCGYDLRASKGRCPECGTAFMRTVKVPQEFVEAGLAFPAAADERLSVLLERDKLGTLTADERAQLKALGELGEVLGRVKGRTGGSVR